MDQLSDTALRRRLELQEILEGILGTNQVYFQPPPNLQMSYPAIIYSHSRANESFANNYLYRDKRGYDVTIIDRDPDSEIPEKVKQLAMCSFDRRYIADSLNHTVYTLYY